MATPLALVCAYYFLVKGTVNVLFIALQTAFFRQAGVEALPYLYTAMNVAYILIQGAVVRRLSARSAAYIAGTSRALLVVLLVRVLAPGMEGAAASAVMLLAVMVYDLLFNLFFTHYVNEVYSLKEAKANLPIITACGSSSFIASGVALKLSLSVLSMGAVLVAAVAGFAVSQALFVLVRRAHGDGLPTAGPRAATARSRPVRRAPGPRLPPLGRRVAALSFLTMAGKYWLDFQYSRAITATFQTEKDLASFIAVYTSATDLLVLVGQLVVAGPALGRLPLVRVLALMPATALAGCLATMATGSAPAVLATQFAFTVLTKMLHTPASSLLFSVMPASDRMAAMSSAGVASSAGCMIVGLALIAVQQWLTTSGAFLVLLLVFATLLALVLTTGPAYAAQLEHTLSAARASDWHEGLEALEALEALEHVSPDARTRQLARLLAGNEEARLAAVRHAARLAPDQVSALLMPAVAREDSPRVIASAARVLCAGGGAAERRRMMELLGDESVDARVRANIAEAVSDLGSSGRLDTGLGPDALARLEPLLDHAHPRLRASAAAAMASLSRETASVEAALRCLAAMRRARADAATRAAAVAALGRIGEEVFLPDLVESLADTDDRVAAQAVSAVARLPSPDSAEALRRTARTRAGTRSGGRAAAELERMGRRLTEGVSQVLDALSGPERAGAERLLGELHEPERLELLLAVLRVPDAGLRGSLTSFVAHRPTGPAVLGRALIATPDGVRLDAGALAGAIADGELDGDALADLVRLLGPAGHGHVADRLVAARLGRLWLDLACRELFGDAPPVVVRREAVDARLAADLARVAALAAERCPWPDRASDALAKARSDDRFVAALALEYLEGQVPSEIRPLLMPLLVAFARRDGAVAAARQALGRDLSDLTLEVACRRLGVEGRG
jgi:HEAT repeat protein